MSKIALLDVDKTSSNVKEKKATYPNFALMKISAYHKNLKNKVEWYSGKIFRNEYDKIYVSSVFTFTKKPSIFDNMITGGTGFNLHTNLPKEIENGEPDYSLYPKMKHAIGFLTRGCIRRCKECFVPEKEGKLRSYRDIETIAQGRKDIILMDNNILACEYGLKQIEKIVDLKLRVDFNQGLDARLIDDNVAKLLSKVRWLPYPRLACDSESMIEPVETAIKLLRKYHHTHKGWKIFVYVLVKNVELTLKISNSLKRFHNCVMYAQPYRDKYNNEPPKELKQFAGWINCRQKFYDMSWKDYKQNYKNNKSGFNFND